MKRLENKVAIITGSAMGMGMETAKLFAEEGAKVVVADFNEDAGKAVVDDIVANGGIASFCKVDISKASQVEAMVQFAVNTYGRLDCAVNNAALKPDNNSFEELDEEYWDKLQAVDLKGTALCMKYELKQFMAQGGGGAIVNISSINAFKPTTGNPAYQAFKHGVEGLTKAAAFEYGIKGIRINSVAPGAIRTPMLTAALQGLGIEEKDIIPTMSLIGRLGEPREVAQGSLFLCSDDASYVHGTVLHVGGGFELL
ncbi:SDR family oxidoreductase [Flavobacterium sp. HXWNR69]|uniref:SDR family oxidoreductase n=1 Tax=Flavobacterium fragile TaxID=2949085 RepID=A0ABT0TJH3_9FLAO|nr:glucose 1-dehydrogenase [Flavobacterium sp. HXWNR69]MCL9771156.1 SDR family oxidoreductase [Flavobacterium sp. HXWNR69]